MLRIAGSVRHLPRKIEPPSHVALATNCSTVRRGLRSSQYDMMFARLMRTSTCRCKSDLHQMTTAHDRLYSCLVIVAKQCGHGQNGVRVCRSSAGSCCSGMFRRDAQRHRCRVQASQCTQSIRGNPAACCDNARVHQRMHDLRPQAAATTAALAGHAVAQAKHAYAPDVQQPTPVGLQRIRSHRRRACPIELVMHTSRSTTT